MKSLYKLPVLFIFLLCFSCDEVLECVFNIEPDVHAKTMDLGFVGDAYYDVITADVKNASNDDSYDYYFMVIGDIPPGIYYDIRRRKIEFFGVPEVEGTYHFEVRLEVEYFDYDDYDHSPTCSDRDVEHYFIHVE